jgi:hypothetical protein
MAGAGATRRSYGTASSSEIRAIQGMNQFPKTFSDEKLTLESWWGNTTLL